MRKIRYILILACLLGLSNLSVMADVPAANIRYVRMEKADGTGGKYTNDGRSWATAKNNVQDAINDLVAAKALPGEVWVGAGIYHPTESTESSGGSTLYMSFKIPGGITLRSGFPENGMLKHQTAKADSGDGISWEVGEDSVYITSLDERPRTKYNSIGWYYTYPATLSGNLTSQEATFVWNETRQQYTTTFFGNSYHVVWFATNGFDANGRANALTREAMVEGFKIIGGNAKSTQITDHPHEAYGGGVYMVKGAQIENCYIMHCEATRDGGGVYMDGGGRMTHCYVTECQAMGQGNTYGYGGGVCVEENNKAYPLIVERSGITSCSGRMGGGIAYKTSNPEGNPYGATGGYKNKNNMATSSLLVANNVASTEGGGVYCMQGGAITQATIVRNRCNGSGIAINGMATGRAGGIYVRDFANIANTVIWGNEASANKNIQFASSRSTSDSNTQPKMRYCYLSKSDYTDWSGVKKVNVKALSDYNLIDDEPAGSSTKNYYHPRFQAPSTTPGYSRDIFIRTLRDLSPVEQAALGSDGTDSYNWKISGRSDMAFQGLYTYDLDAEHETPAEETTVDIDGTALNHRPSIGAYTSDAVGGGTWLETKADNKVTAHMFIDPNDESGMPASMLAIASSWTYPARFLNDVLYEAGSQISTYKMMLSMTSTSILPTGVTEAMRTKLLATKVALMGAEHKDVSYTLQDIYIHIKEGTINNNSSHDLTGKAREINIEIPNTIDVPLYIMGGYPATLTDHDISVRTPMKTPTVLTGKITDDYSQNAGHLFVIVNNPAPITIDGFNIRHTNAIGLNGTSRATSEDGGAFVLVNANDVSVKNCQIANCQAKTGPAVYALNTNANFENCIFHNNASTLQHGVSGNKNAVIYTGSVGAPADFTLTFEHCDVLRNVGYPAWMDGTAKTVWKNSILYANMNTPLDDTNGSEGNALPSFGGTTANATGSYCFFDNQSAAYEPQITASHFDLSYTFDASATNSTYPRFINPTKNAGVSTGIDNTYYGRSVSFEPHNTNPIVNAATYAGDHSTWGTDISCVTTRDYGGLPDVGAVENHYDPNVTANENAYQDGQKAWGAIMYVKDFRNGDGTIDYASGGDGSSWLNAINGNAYYYEDGSHSGEASKEVQKGQHWVAGGTVYSRGNNVVATTQNIVLQNANGEYLYYTGSALSTTTNIANATLFTLVKNGNYYRLSFTYSTQTRYVGIVQSGSWPRYTYSLTTNTNTTDYAYYWTIYDTAKSSTFKNRRYNSYYIASNAGAGTSSATWSFYTRKESQEEGHYEPDYTTVSGLNGLQYAVNKQGDAFTADASKEQREVWVSAGTYSKDNETGDKSCFIIRDGVNVYGAFPKVGNPGKDQRQALVSKYVNNTTGYDPTDYETVLQPITQTIAAGATRRVLGQVFDYNPNSGTGKNFVSALWDGFTLRKGILDAAQISLPNGNGGAGACIYNNVTLRNVVVTDNTTIYNGAESATDYRAGGIYMNGGTLEGGYVINNLLQGWSSGSASKNGAAYGGGMYIYKGTVFNSVIANNKIYASYSDGAGLFIENANFFNNTIVNNYADGSNRACGGVAIWQSGGGSTLNVYNTIILNNSGASGGIGNADVRVPQSGRMYWNNCIVASTNNCGSGAQSITFNNCRTATMSNALFAIPGNYSDRANDQFKNLNLRLAAGSVAINSGLVNPTINDVTYNLSTYTDMDYTERVKDCSIDIGAYEYNDAYAIAPTVEGNVASYYVTPNGRGLASASTPANAGCADKLQKVLDAAGRYKFQNPTKQVIVRVAKSTTDADFTYYANRTINPDDQDVRIWSIIVPHGVEVWGGYTDTYTDDANHGFKTRDITGNQTVFDATYENKTEKSHATSYHVVYFSDRIYDGNGNPYLATDNDLTHNSSYLAGNIYQESEFKHMSDNASLTDRAVLDGIFLTGGKANAATTNTEFKALHQFGGAAIVEPYAHVRNCIIEDNTANYGGALALKPKALVSGCLIVNNEAGQGGAIYAFEEGDKLSDGTTIPAAATSSDMAQVYLSTIVRNNATEQGGGLWFTHDVPNVRFNSNVIWKNTATDQGNVSGNYNPSKPDDNTQSPVEFYPFSYSAVENMRLSGTNNISLAAMNKEGARFCSATNSSAVATDDNDYGFYGLTNISALVRKGMSVDEYTAALTKGIATHDFTGTDRLVSAPNAPERSYVEIGARALDKTFEANKLMLRLYVAQEEDIDADAANDMMSLAALASSAAEPTKSLYQYYCQEGSSFANPFHSLQDALDYIYLMRSNKIYKDGKTYLETYKANNLPFEIILSRGTYYPSRDMAGNYGQSRANTFAIPEGVSIYGGFYAQGQRSTTLGGNATEPNAYFGMYSTPKATIPEPVGTADYYIEDNVDNPETGKDDITVDGKTYYLYKMSTTNMCLDREHVDVNANDIIEPWEFKYQAILSGDAINATNQGVYHVLTAVADQDVVGVLPDRSIDRTKSIVEGNNQVYVADTNDPLYSYTDHEEGQNIVLDGLTITGGNATSYQPGSTGDIDIKSYYHGGGLMVDGNRYNNRYNDSLACVAAGTSFVPTGTVYKHGGVSNAVAYRDLPVAINRCHFLSNDAGYGGAISANASIDIFSSSFERNRALEGSDNVTTASGNVTIKYPGNGGALYGTHHMVAMNTLLANNEAVSLTHDMTPRQYPTYRNNTTPTKVSYIFSGCGGATYTGKHGFIHLLNCDVVRNAANVYPAMFTMNPNYYTSAWATGDQGSWNSTIGSFVPGAGFCPITFYNQITNSVVWGNEITATGLTAGQKFAANLICNFGPANRNGADYSVSAYPTSQTDLDDAAHDADQTQKNWSENAWYSAYESGRGITPKNDNDFRIVDYNPYLHAIRQMSAVSDGNGGTYPYQNCNISLSSSNTALEGPAFVSPSLVAGYDGFTESADWSPGRLNNLTDNGHGRIVQTINPSTKQVSFNTATAAKWPGMPASVSLYDGTGTYTQIHYLPGYTHYNRYLPFGNDLFMQTASGESIQRISPDPNPTHNQTFIDLGLYEYVHVQLEPQTEEDEVDILWVSNLEKPENGKPDGSNWLQPTSDMQRAIETLLASRNGHRKEIRVCDGTYSPIYTIDGKLSFYIDSKYINDATVNTDNKGIKSLVIKGGYSKDYYKQNDVDLYPTIFKMQEHAATTSTKYDHLFLINDATQRYGATAYNGENHFGWNNTTPQTFPIQLDGLTLMNDQATASAQGAAIYYRNPSFDAEYKPTDGAATYTAATTTEASVTTDINADETNHTSSPKANPAKLILSKTTIMGSGDKQKGKGSSAVYIGQAGGNTLVYNSLFHSNYGDPLVAWNAQTVNNTFALNAGQVKLNNYGSVSTDSASYIKNSVLWKNNATSATTFGDQFLLAGQSKTAGGDYDFSTTENIFAYNAFTGGNTGDIDYDPSTGTTIKGNHHNVGLVDHNTDVTYGPNFNDPENSSIEKRNFHISPSMRLLNKGSNTLYGSLDMATPAFVYDLSWAPTKAYDCASSSRIAAGDIDLGAFEYQYDLNRVLYVDPNKAVSGDGLSWQNALGFGGIQNAIDLAGVAFTNLHKPTYVFVKASSATNQDLHTGETLTMRDGVQVYGSVRSDYGVECPYTLPSAESKEREYNDTILTAYMGDVLLYGRFGVLSPVEGHTRISGITTNGTAFTTTTVKEDGNDVPNKNLHPTVIDGFEVMPKNAASSTITKPAIYVNPYQSDGVLATGNVQVCLRNIGVHGFQTNGCNVAEVDNALLYSTLMHHNTPSSGKAVMKVGANGYLANATIEGNTIGANGAAEINGGSTTLGSTDYTAEGNSHIYHSLVNFGGSDATSTAIRKTLSGYCYAMEDDNLNYQLTEMSPYINSCSNAAPLPTTGATTYLVNFLNQCHVLYSAAEAAKINTLIDNSYLSGIIGSKKLHIYDGKYKAADRDLLGNFRWQAKLAQHAAFDAKGDPTDNIIDRGAFETWKVETDHECVYPNYPHPGTCEYIMAGQSLVINPVDPEGDPTTAAHMPGFVLLQEGASLYGNGREIQISYIAVEHRKQHNQDLLLSAPWDQKMLYTGLDNETNTTHGVFIPSYDANGVLQCGRRPKGALYTYDASARSDWQYRMASADSKCWKPIAKPVQPACQGMLLHDDNSDLPNEPHIYRFTGRGNSLTDYIYTELVETDEETHISKSVTLTQNDDHTSTDGGGDFTDSKNAGWNLIGMPYLTSDYHPYDKPKFDANGNIIGGLKPGDAGYDDAPYSMEHPQTMWIYYNGTTTKDGTTPVDGTGGFYSVNSWETTEAAWHVAAGSDQNKIFFGEAFFVQTNTLQDSEDLIFHRPVYYSKTAAPVSKRIYVGDTQKPEADVEDTTEPGQKKRGKAYWEKKIISNQLMLIHHTADGRTDGVYDTTGRRVK